MYWKIIALFLSFASLQLREILAKEKYIDEDSMLYWRRSNVEKCEPFTKFTDRCNRCICGADGIKYCTRMFCVREGRNIRKADEEYYNY